jgi:hypothetical protein
MSARRSRVQLVARCAGRLRLQRTYGSRPAAQSSPPRSSHRATATRTARGRDSAHGDASSSDRIRSASQPPRFNPHSNAPTAVQFNRVVGSMPTIRVGGVDPLTACCLLSLTLLRVLRVYLAARPEFTRRAYRSADGIRAAITIDTDAVAAQLRFAESGAISVCPWMATASQPPAVDPPTRLTHSFNCGRLTFNYRSSFDLQLRSVNSLLPLSSSNCTTLASLWRGCAVQHRYSWPPI